MLEWGPSVIVAKQGEYGAALITAEGFFWLPAFPLETVVDPTGAGDTFAGGFMGYLAAHSDRPSSTTQLLRRAMAYGTALASFNVEDFGIERVRAADGGERSPSGSPSSRGSPTSSSSRRAARLTRARAAR